MFIKTSAENALKEAILENLNTREVEACDTWDLKAVLGYAVGVKIPVDMSEVEAISEYMATIQGAVLTLSDSRQVTLMKGDVKARNDKANLIFRYQLIQG